MGHGLIKAGFIAIKPRKNRRNCAPYCAVPLYTNLLLLIIRTRANRPPLSAKRDEYEQLVGFEPAPAAIEAHDALALKM